MSAFKNISEKLGSQKSAALALGVSKSTWSSWQKLQKIPSPENVAKITEKFGPTWQEILRPFYDPACTGQGKMPE
jgi:DNA-binding transcriptional regulator YdaS (Cro superfamily)